MAQEIKCEECMKKQEVTKLINALKKLGYTEDVNGTINAHIIIKNLGYKRYLWNKKLET